MSLDRWMKYLKKKIQKMYIFQWNFCQGNMTKEQILQFNV